MTGWQSNALRSEAEMEGWQSNMMRTGEEQMTAAQSNAMREHDEAEMEGWQSNMMRAGEEPEEEDEESAQSGSETPSGRTPIGERERTPRPSRSRGRA